MRRIHMTDGYLLDPSHPVTVDLIGVGGTGSQVLTSLARINHALQELGHPGLRVVAYDDDIVTESNIGRQLFSPSDLGHNKAEVLTTRLNRFFGTDWGIVPERFDSYNSSSANITISCVDSVNSRLCIDKALDMAGSGYDHLRRIYWLDFGNTTNTGQVVLGTVGDVQQPESTDEVDYISDMRTVTELFDLTKVDERDSGPSCSLAEALRKQDLFINSTLAQLGSALLWKLLSTGSIDYQGMFLNLETMKVNPIKL